MLVISWHGSRRNYCPWGAGDRSERKFAMDEILTADEMADYLKVDVKTVYRLAKLGKIPGRKVGGSWRFKKDALCECLAGSKETHPWVFQRNRREGSD